MCLGSVVLKLLCGKLYQLPTLTLGRQLMCKKQKSLFTTPGVTYKPRHVLSVITWSYWIHVVHCFHNRAYNIHLRILQVSIKYLMWFTFYIFNLERGQLENLPLWHWTSAHAQMQPQLCPQTLGHWESAPHSLLYGTSTGQELGLHWTMRSSATNTSTWWTQGTQETQNTGETRN